MTRLILSNLLGIAGSLCVAIFFAALFPVLVLVAGIRLAFSLITAKGVVTK